MLNVYIGAWWIQRVLTQTDCLGTCSQWDHAVPGLTLARNHIPLNISTLSTASFPKPGRPHCCDCVFFFSIKLKIVESRMMEQLIVSPEQLSCKHQRVEYKGNIICRAESCLCAEWGLEVRPWVEVCAGRACKRGLNTRVRRLELLGAGRASMAAKRPPLRWQPEVHCVPELKDSWENSH